MSFCSRDSHSLSRLQAYISGHADHPGDQCDVPSPRPSENEIVSTKKTERRVQVNMAVQIREYHPLDAPGTLNRTDSATELLSDHPDLQTQKPLGRLRVIDFEVTSDQDSSRDGAFPEAASRLEVAT